jgi:hypothetical protein
MLHGILDGNDNLCMSDWRSPTCHDVLLRFLLAKLVDLSDGNEAPPLSATRPWRKGSGQLHTTQGYFSERGQLEILHRSHSVPVYSPILYSRVSSISSAPCDPTLLFFRRSLWPDLLPLPINTGITNTKSLSIFSSTMLVTMMGVSPQPLRLARVTSIHLYSPLDARPLLNGEENILWVRYYD